MAFDAILFDCDGVLVDSEILGLEDCARYLRGHGLAWSGADLVRLFTGLRDDVFAERLAAAYGAVHGRPPPEGFFEGLIEERRKRRHALQPVRGAKAALEAIRLPRAVASSSRAVYLESKLRRVGLWDLVAPHVYSAETVARGKPAPDIYLYAAERLGADPARCLVVEDSAHGVESGRAAGMTVWGFLGGGHCFEGHDARLVAAGATWIARDFDALLARLESRPRADDAGEPPKRAAGGAGR
ncbi:HAD family hydrolase [Amphiplicatus metriothermophilus]|uniref:Haloacid dehalogenase superfamily, subfamily IA, variant 3 with third motif having DD or ED n=1 Tax=Amphiplicatus metriothermophilus TaxID=1519374 RepID=A0A239PLG6_9PROT|nr:HAD-IA family hydrolase [Amphiplicatus metriothermophilus]MBB5517742.1 HAD superfamily hydrolase (TIGR01509 family) [Amphiplicatus metriothermophilus]SNT67924.1 haloacid dehalogenase superfamily, subfamily IA, variant 3 with third motif having DD or ED [Amphiplicatus metriothermophilus]